MKTPGTKSVVTNTGAVGHEPSPPSPAGQGSPSWLAAAALLVAGVATRFWGLGRWAYAGDELYTLKAVASGAFPWFPKGGYFVAASASAAVLGLSEFALRFPAAVLGAVAIPLLYVLGTRLVGRNGALAAAAMLLFSPWHLYHSQFARFYAGTFLAGLLTSFLLWKALTRDSPVRGFGAVVSAMLGTWIHPTAVLALAPGLASPLLMRWMAPAPALGPRMRRWLGVSAILLGIGAMGLAMMLLPKWTQLRQGWGYGPIAVLAQWVKYADPAMTVAAALGLLLLRRRDPRLCAFLLGHALVGACFLAVFATFTSVRPDYVFTLMPALLLAAGVACTASAERANHRLWDGALMILILVSMLPGFVSHYSSRLTLDPRSAITYVLEHRQPGDVIVSMMNAAPYWPPEAQPARHPGSAYVADVDWEKELQGYLGNDRRVWILIRTKRRSMAPALERWLADHASLVWEKDALRFDYTSQGIRIYLRRSCAEVRHRCEPSHEAPVNQTRRTRSAPESTIGASPSPDRPAFPASAKD